MSVAVVDKIPDTMFMIQGMRIQELAQFIYNHISNWENFKFKTEDFLKQECWDYAVDVLKPIDVRRDIGIEVSIKKDKKGYPKFDIKEIKLKSYW